MKFNNKNNFENLIIVAIKTTFKEIHFFQIQRIVIDYHTVIIIDYDY